MSVLRPTPKLCRILRYGLPMAKVGDKSRKTPVPENVVANVPFKFTRTKSENLPIYMKYITARRVPITVVRKYEGDGVALRDEIQKLVGPHVRVELHPGSISVAGNYISKVRNWLVGLGF